MRKLLGKLFGKSNDKNQEESIDKFFEENSKYFKRSESNKNKITNILNNGITQDLQSIYNLNI